MIFEQFKWNWEDLRGAGHPHAINRDLCDSCAATGWGEDHPPHPLHIQPGFTSQRKQEEK